MLTTIRGQDFTAIGYGALVGLAAFIGIAAISADTGLGSALPRTVPGWLEGMAFGGRFLHAVILGQVVSGFSAGFLYEGSPARATIRGYLSASFGYLVPAIMVGLLIGFSMFGVPRGPYFGFFFLVDWLIGVVVRSSPIFVTAGVGAIFGRIGQYTHANHITPSQLKERAP